MRNLIIKSYQQSVALAPVPEELKRALKTHERVPGFLSSLERNLISVPRQLRTAQNIEATVHDMTMIFLNGLVQKAEEARMSDAVKQGMLDKAAKAKRYDELSTGREAIDLDELMEVAPDGNDET